MRIMWSCGDIDEFVILEKVWNQEGSEKYKGSWVIHIGLLTEKGINFEFEAGIYEVNGTREDYNKAIEGYNKIALHALKDGYITEEMLNNYGYQ